MNIKRFEISNLHNDHDVSLEIKDNIVILVAENGTGKTTILRILYLFLSKQWAKLTEFDFDQIRVTINHREFIFDKKKYNNSQYSIDQFQKLAEKYPVYAHFIKNDLSKYRINELVRNSYMLTEIEHIFDVPYNLLSSLINELSNSHFDDKSFDWDSSIVYLPTYRRIEKGFDTLFGDLDQRLEKYIKSILPDTLGENLGVDELDIDLTSVFSDLWLTRDQEKWKKTHNSNANIEMIEFGMGDVKDKLAKVLRRIEEGESSLLEELGLFSNIVNKYLTNNKSLIIDVVSRKVEISYQGKNKKLNLENLSSGEKQIISIFCHLFFNQTKRLVIIDEPELSLSISWQENFIEDLLKANVSGVFIATHSPFIVADDYIRYTIGVNEFIK